MNEKVTEYIDNIKIGWQADICKQLRPLIHNSIPDVEERIQYGKPHYLKNGKYAVVLGTAKNWVSLTIFNAQNLETPDGLFETSPNGERKTIKFHETQTVDGDLLAGLIEQAAQTL